MADFVSRRGHLRSRISAPMVVPGCTGARVQRSRANALLAMGASPTAADHEADARGQFARLAHTPLIRVGTSTKQQQSVVVAAMEAAPRRDGMRDPISAGATGSHAYAYAYSTATALLAAVQQQARRLRHRGACAAHRCQWTRQSEPASGPGSLKVGAMHVLVRAPHRFPSTLTTGDEP